jgi:hypothetical protein
MNIHKIFTDDTVEVDKSEATKEAPCGAVLPSKYSNDESIMIKESYRDNLEAQIAQNETLKKEIKKLKHGEEEQKKEKTGWSDYFVILKECLKFTAYNTIMSCQSVLVHLLKK